MAEALAEQRLRGREEGRRSGFLSVLTRIALSLLRRDVSDTVRMVEAEGPQRALSGLLRLSEASWVPRWASGVSGVLAAVMEDAPLPTDRGPIRLGFDLSNPETEAFFSSYRLRLAEQVTSTTREKLEAAIRKGIEEGLSVPEVAQKVSDVGQEFAGYRSETIARTELHRAALESSEMQAKRSGVVNRKTWRSTNDARTREEHRKLDGVSVGIDEVFEGGLHPATEINCRCTVEYGISDELLRRSVA